MTTTEAIETIENRVDFLARKLATDTSGRKLYRERQEIGALQMAIDELMAKRTRAHTRKVSDYGEGCSCTEP